MKKILLNISAIAIGLISMVSCTNVLDKPAVDSFNAQLVFSDINVVNAYLGKCYDLSASIRDSSLYNNAHI